MLSHQIRDHSTPCTGIAPLLADVHAAFGPGMLQQQLGMHQPARWNPGGQVPLRFFFPAILAVQPRLLHNLMQPSPLPESRVQPLQLVVVLVQH